MQNMRSRTSAWGSGLRGSDGRGSFSLTGIPFTEQHIDDFTFARETWRTTTQFKW